MKHRRNLTCTVLVLLALLVSPMTAQAFPALPSSFYGVVEFNGENVPDGTLVEALIDNQVVAQGLTQTYEDASVYSLDVKGDDTDTPGKDGGVEDDIIHFRVGGLDAEQTGTWHSGTNVSLDLTVTSTEALNSPQSTPVAVATQTTIGYAPTETLMPISVTSSEAKKQSAPVGMLVGAAIVVVCAAVAALIVRKKH